MTKQRTVGMLAGVALGGLASASAIAAPFNAADLVVFQAGTGAAALSSAATTDLLDEYTVAGTQVQQITLPTTSSGTATSEGQITTGPTGLLAVEGYNVAVGTASVTGTTPSATANQRVVDVVDSTGAINSTTQLSNAFSGNNIRGAVTDGTNVFVSGTSATAATATAGIQAAPIGGSTAAQVEAAVTNTRAVNLVGGNLFFSTASGIPVASGGTATQGIYEVAGTSATGTSTPTLIAADTTGGSSPYAFLFTSLTGVGAPTGLNTLYVADSGSTTVAGSIEKFSLVGGAYTLTGSVTVPGTAGSTAAAITGLTGVVPAAAGASAGAVADLYVTSPTNLYSYVDTSGYGVAPSTAVGPTSIATAATNTAFRGVALTPTGTSAVPEPTSVSLLALGALGLVARRRRQA